MSEYFYGKLKSMIYGFIVGDAIGVPVEFKDRLFLKKNPVKDMMGFGTYNQPVGSWSDDTSLTLCLLDSINLKDDIIDKELLSKNILNWYHYNDFTATGKRFDIGFTTEKAILNLDAGYELYCCGPKNKENNGNGALMRISPLVFLTLDMNMEDRFKILKDVVSITHGHEINIVGCHLYLEFMTNILKHNDFSKMKLLEETVNDLKYFYNSSYLSDYLNILNKFYKRVCNKEIFKKKFFKYDESIIKSSGYVVDSLEASLFCFITSKSYKESILKAVNLGEDTDTISAITGSISGLFYDFDSIPVEWIEKLQNKELINIILEQKKKEL